MQQILPPAWESRQIHARIDAVASIRARKPSGDVKVIEWTRLPSETRLVYTYCSDSLSVLTACFRHICIPSWGAVPVSGFFGGSQLQLETHKAAPVERAIAWVKAHRIPGSGILAHHRHKAVSQEVTGYLIPTLYRLGERDLARDLASWEASVQRRDGAFTAPDGIPYTFDTAQVARGFLAVLDEMRELEGNLRRACDFITTQIASNGEIRSPSYDMWRLPEGGVFSKYTNLYVLPPLLEAGQRLSEPRYVAAVERSINYFTERRDLTDFKPRFDTLSHVFGYMMEALVELGEVGLARRGLQQVVAIQKDDGAIPAYPGATWTCSTGAAQLAVAWYKLGQVEHADKALAYLERMQLPGGGFFGSYGVGAAYFPSEEISWAVKFFLDCFVAKRERSI